MPPSKKRGRPRKGPLSAKTAVFSTRITPELRKALERAADKAGGSLSDEIERRLWQSFNFDEERQKLFAGFGGGQNYAACRVIAELMKALTAATGKRWPDDVWTFDQLTRGVARLFRAWRPAGETERPGLRHYSPEDADRLGELFAQHELTDLFFTEADDPSAPYVRTQLKRDLGTLAERSNSDEKAD